MQKNVKECQRMSKNVKECQQMSKNIKECQRMCRLSDVRCWARKCNSINTIVFAIEFFIELIFIVSDLTCHLTTRVFYFIRTNVAIANVALRSIELLTVVEQQSTNIGSSTLHNFPSTILLRRISYIET